MASRRAVSDQVLASIRWIVRRWDLGLLLVAMLLTLRYEGPPAGDLDAHISRLLTGEQFDFAGWEIQALLDISKEESSMVIIYPMASMMGQQIAAATAGHVGGSNMSTTFTVQSTTEE